MLGGLLENDTMLKARFLAEMAHMLKTWEPQLARDPAYNPNLTLAREDFSLADPPRAGLHADVAAGLLRLKPGRILLVSCHMATLARDLGILSKGYDLRAVQGVDLFPHSAHVEVLCLLSARV